MKVKTYPQKMCVDCKHHTVEAKQHVCLVYAFTNTDIITGGKSLVGKLLCSFMRDREGDCGREGKLWQAKGDDES